MIEMTARCEGRDGMRMRQTKRGRVKMKEAKGRRRATAREDDRRGGRDKMAKLMTDTKGRENEVERERGMKTSESMKQKGGL